MLEIIGVLLLLAYTWFTCLQWLQIRYTNNLTAHALDGNDKALSQTTTKMQGQIDATKNLYKEAQKQTGQAAILAANAGTQAAEAKVSADAATSAANTAKDTLHISERAYVAFAAPINEFQNGRIMIPIENTGHVPSGLVQVVQHEVTFKMSPETAQHVPQSDFIESHWVATTLASVPPVSSGTSVYDTIVTLPKLVQSDLNTGMQGFVVVLVMTYNDGFPGTPTQTWKFCENSSFLYETKRLDTGVCDPDVLLKTVIVSDHYPDPDYQAK